MVLPIAYGKKFCQGFHKNWSWVHSCLTYSLRFILTTEGNYFTNYADDTTPCDDVIIGNNDEEVVFKLKAITKKLFTWFAQNEMKANLNKSHLLVSATDAFNL